MPGGAGFCLSTAINRDCSIQILNVIGRNMPKEKYRHVVFFLVVSPASPGKQLYRAYPLTNVTGGFVENPLVCVF